MVCSLGELSQGKSLEGNKPDTFLVEISKITTFFINSTPTELRLLWIKLYSPKYAKVS
jgi:hypothetical protein